jgi:hypothetical protein
MSGKTYQFKIVLLGEGCVGEFMKLLNKFSKLLSSI